MINEELIFKLFTNCIPVKGARRSLICDLQRNTNDFIPNILYDILTRYKDRSIREIKSFYDENNHKHIESYFTFLLNKEYGFLTDEPALFPDMDLSWDSPSKVTNAILDIDQHSDYDISKAVQELVELRCEAIQVRCYGPYNPLIDTVLKICTQSLIRAIELIVQYDENHPIEFIKNLCTNNPRISNVILHSALVNQIHYAENKVPIVQTQHTITSEHHCGEVNSSYFSTNIPLFTESQCYNTCLNRKISINKEGNICNCPSMSKTFGKINEQRLSTALEHADFKKLWNINKDQIDICKDCEFRYICTDCRVYIENAENIYSKPAKCNYDPYTAKWV